MEREDEAEREATAGGFREFNLDDEAQLVEKAKFDEMMRVRVWCTARPYGCWSSQRDVLVCCVAVHLMAYIAPGLI